MSCHVELANNPNTTEYTAAKRPDPDNGSSCDKQSHDNKNNKNNKTGKHGILRDQEQGRNKATTQHYYTTDLGRNEALVGQASSRIGIGSCGRGGRHPEISRVQDSALYHLCRDHLVGADAFSRSGGQPLSCLSHTGNVVWLRMDVHGHQK